MKKLFILFNLIFIQICNGQPSILFNQPDSGCVGTTFTIDAIVFAPGDSALNFAWDFGDGSAVLNTPFNSVTHQYNIAGNFAVTLITTFSIFGNDTVIAIDLIKTGNHPNAQIDTVPVSLCFQGNFQFLDNSTGNITGWLWDFGDGGSSWEQWPTHEFNLDTSGAVDPFDIILVAYDNGCPDTVIATDLITVLGPIPNFASIYNCDNRDSVAFVNLSGGADSYTWDFGDGSPVSTAINETHVFPNTGSYSVTLICASLSSGCTVDTILPVQLSSMVVSTISEAGGNLYCSFTDPSYNYVWYCNDVMVTGQGSYCIPNQTGNFYVVIYGVTGCADTSSTYSFTLGVGTILSGNEVSISPNPLTTSNLLIKIKEPFSEKLSLNIYNAIGRKIISDITVNSQVTPVDMESFTAGIYFVSLEGNNGRKVFKLIKD